MRKLLSTFIFALMTMVTFAQGEHMTFKGIPLQGPLNTFIQKLKDKGFTHMEQTKDGALLKGKFATYNDCLVFVYTEKSNVSSVVVLFPEQETWNAITNRYYTLKEMLTEKYGMPETIERFSDEEPISDFLRFYALLKDECIYKSEFKTKNGSIVLTMKKVDYRTASVIIKYNDNINEEESRKTMMDDL
ncbi:MAG: hypothetical protein VZQ98_06430 [Bacteroidales bacterium]|nr:hypothetical protein [Bacteroidales bacterium]